MRRHLYIIMCIAVCGTLCGKPIDRKAEKLPVDVQKQIVAIQTAAQSNDWAAVRKAYDAIDWRQVRKPSDVLKVISRELKGDDNAKDLRREIKTKYELLKEPDDAELDDTISATSIPRITIPRVAIPEVDVPIINIPIVDFPQVDVPHIVINRIQADTILPAVALWQSAYSKLAGPVPLAGTVLWYERQIVLKAIEDGGTYATLLDAYNEHYQKLVWRRDNLIRSRR